MMRFLLLLLFGLFPGTLFASPPDVSDFAYQQRVGSQMPLTAVFRDETGDAASLGAFIGTKPVVLALGYYHCPNLCGVVRDDLLQALTQSGLRAGLDYTLVALSIDPSETSETAATAKAQDLARYPTAGARHDWHYLTGDAAAIQAVATAVGFKDRSDPIVRQFLHPAGLVFATRSGLVSSYLLGVGYRPGDVRLAVTRAAAGTIENAALPVLLLCFHYDPETGRYTLAIMKLVEIASILTVLVVGGTIALALHRESTG